MCPVCLTYHEPINANAQSQATSQSPDSPTSRRRLLPTPTRPLSPAAPYLTPSYQPPSDNPSSPRHSPVDYYQQHDSPRYYPTSRRADEPTCTREDEAAANDYHHHQSYGSPRYYPTCPPTELFSPTRRTNKRHRHSDHQANSGHRSFTPAPTAPQQPGTSHQHIADAAALAAPHPAPQPANPWAAAAPMAMPPQAAAQQPVAAAAHQPAAASAPQPAIAAAPIGAPAAIGPVIANLAPAPLAVNWAAYNPPITWRDFCHGGRLCILRIALPGPPLLAPAPLLPPGEDPPSPLPWPPSPTSQVDPADSEQPDGPAGGPHQGPL